MNEAKKLKTPDGIRLQSQTGSCLQKGSNCMIPGSRGICSYFVENGRAELGCEMPQNGSWGSGPVNWGSASGSGGPGSVPPDFYCEKVNAGGSCFPTPTISGKPYSGMCTYFYTGNGNYRLSCKIDYNSGPGSSWGSGSGSGWGSGSGSETNPEEDPDYDMCNTYVVSCNRPCMKFVRNHWKSGTCKTINRECVCVFD